MVTQNMCTIYSEIRVRIFMISNSFNLVHSLCGKTLQNFSHSVYVTRCYHLFCV